MTTKVVLWQKIGESAMSAKTYDHHIPANLIRNISDILVAKLQQTRFPNDFQIEQVLKIHADKIASDFAKIVEKYVWGTPCYRQFHIPVDRTRTPEEAIKATSERAGEKHPKIGPYKLNLSKSVVEAMPKGEVDEAEVILFQHHRVKNMEDVEKEYEREDLIPASPYSLLALIETLPFCDISSGGFTTFWKDESDTWYHINFTWWDSERDERFCTVGVGYPEHKGYDINGLFAGFRK